MVLLVGLSMVNKLLHKLLANDVVNCHKQLVISFEGNVAVDSTHRLSKYITVVAKAVRPSPGIPGILEVRPQFVNLKFYVKTGILPSNRWRRGTIEGYDKIEFYDKSSFPTINAQALFIPSPNWFCDEISWPPPNNVSINVKFDGIILKKPYNLRCLA